MLYTLIFSHFLNFKFICCIEIFSNLYLQLQINNNLTLQCKIFDFLNIFFHRALGILVISVLRYVKSNIAIFSIISLSGLLLLKIVVHWLWLNAACDFYVKLQSNEINEDVHTLICLGLGLV